MKAHGLKPIDTVFESTATLIQSRHPSDPKLLDKIASRISGVISEYPPTFNIYPLISRSGPEVRTLSIQHPTEASGGSYESYTWQASTYRYEAGRCRLDGYLEHGSEGTASWRYGRADSLWCDRYTRA